MGLFGDSYTCALSDIDDDGDLDIVVVSVAQPIQLFLNHEGELRNWLKIKLSGDGGNAYSVGARIDLFGTDLVAQRHVLAGEGFKSSSSFVQHIGLCLNLFRALVALRWMRTLAPVNGLMRGRYLDTLFVETILDPLA